jgi:hypothetical protein
MTITFQKRQKEMKRQEKARAKAERRAQKKLIKRAEKEAATEHAPVAVEPEAQSQTPAAISNPD